MVGGIERWGLPVCLALACSSFLPALGFGFVYDDALQLVGNPNVHGWAGLGKAFTDHVWSFDPTKAGTLRYYRPLFMVVLTLGWQAFQSHAAGYHALSLLLHLCAGSLVWRVAQELQVPARERLVALTIFLLHPMQIQAVAFISAVSEPMVAIAALSSCLAWMRWLRCREPRFLFGALVLYAMALLTLERAVAMAGPLLLLGWYRYALLQPSAAAPSLALRARSSALQASLLSLPASGVFALRRLTIGAGAPAPTGWLRDTLISAPAVVIRYLRNLALPLDLAPTYPERSLLAPTFGNFGLPLLAVLLLAWLAWWSSRDRPLRLFLLGSAVSLLAPGLCVGLLPGHALVQDRYLYLPLAFLGLWLAELVRGASTQPAPRGLLAARALLMAWLLVALFQHPHDLEYFRDDHSFFTRAVEVAPDNPQFLLNLAVAERNQGARDAGCDHVQRAVSALAGNPRWGDPVAIYFNFGNCLREQGRKPESLAAYEQAYRWSAGALIEAGVDRVVLLAELQRPDDAARAAQSLTRLHGDSAVAWKTLGLVAANRGDWPTALRAMQRARTLAPDDASTQQLLERIRRASAAPPSAPGP